MITGAFNKSQFAAIFRFEVKYQLKKMSTWIYSIIILVLTFFWVIGYADFARDLGLDLNSPFMVASLSAFPHLFALLIIPAMASNAAMRDIHSRIYTLFYTTPLGRLNYILGRFFGVVFLLIILMIAAVPMAVFLSIKIGLVEHSLLGPFQIYSYLFSYFLFTIPNILISTAIIYSTIILTKSPVIGYIAGLILFLCSVMSMDVLAESVEYGELANLLDFSGATVLKELRISSAFDAGKDIPNILFLNRVIWISLALTLLTIGIIRFRFVYNGINRRKKKFSESSDFVQKETSLPFRSIPVSLSYDFKARSEQTCAIFKRSFVELFLNPGSIAFIGISVIMIFVLPALLMEPSGIKNLPSTGRLITLMDNIFVRISIATIITLLTGQLVWREREEHINDILDTTPVKNKVVVIGKILGMGTMLLFFQTLLIATGIIVQLLEGYYAFEMTQYLQMHYGYYFFQSLLFSALAFSIHVIVNHKYVGYMIFMLFYFYTVFPDKVGIDNDLLVFGSPFLDYSFFYSLDGSGVPWILFKLYWLGWSLLLIAIAKHLWVRGRENSYKSRWKKMITLKRFSLISLIGIMLILLCGGLISTI